MPAASSSSADARSGRALLLAATVPLAIAWGVAARAWMRLVSSDPEFTLSGSVFVVVVFAVALVLQAAAHLLTGRSSRLDVAATAIGWIGVVALGLGPGMVAVPLLVAGPVALGPTRRPATRIVMATVAVADLGLLLGLALADLWWPRAVLGWVAMILLYGVFIRARVAVRRRTWRDRPLGPARVTVVGSMLGAGAVVFAILAMRGA